MKKILLFALCGLLLQAQASTKNLKKEDIHKTMGELFTYHVEYKNLTPLLVKRSFKVFIENFDPSRIYLLQSEIKPFLDMNADQLALVVERYKRGDFSDYEKLAQVISKAIVRSRSLRLEIKDAVKAGKAEGYSSYAKDLSQLKERILQQYQYFLSLEGVKGNVAQDKIEKLFALWEKRLARLEDNYLFSASRKEHYLVLHLLKALAKSLDAHTSYYSPEEADELKAALEKQFEGIGVVLREGIDGIAIVGLVKGGPAEICGKVQEGDVIEVINGKLVSSLTYEEVLERLKGERGDVVTLGLRREKELVQVPIKRDKITISDERVRHTYVPFGDGIIGKIDLPSFYESGDGSSCEEDLKAAIKQLKSQGKVLGLVVDMRENAGGFLHQAVKVGGLFITSGVVVISKYAEGEIQYLRAIDGRSTYSGPLVILTSKASASAAEIVAGALQDYGTAIIVGDERTYGKGSIQYQTVTENHPKVFFKVTVGKYYTVSGKSTQIEGVKGDILVPTQYSPFRIGEKYLDYPLPRDQMAPAFVDPLADLDGRNKKWFEKHYLPYIQQKTLTWRKMLPILQEASAYRLEHDKNFTAYLKHLDEAEKLPAKTGVWGDDDLQMKEAVDIVQDMILLQKEQKIK